MTSSQQTQNRPRSARKWRWRLALIVAASFFPPPATAAELGVGAIFSSHPGLSVQYAPESNEAYHAVFHMSNDAAAIGLDYQRFHFPGISLGRELRLGLYGGFGLIGEADRAAAERGLGDAGETWSLRLPVGVQLDFANLHLSTFLEGAMTVGPLPQTTVGVAAAGGVRAYF